MRECGFIIQRLRTITRQVNDSLGGVIGIISWIISGIHQMWRSDGLENGREKQHLTVDSKNVDQDVAFGCGLTGIIEAFRKLGVKEAIL